MESAKPAPTGCYKCGRPGHWSRDCTASVPGSNSEPHLKQAPSSHANFKKPTLEKAKKERATRPKLTPELLLGDEGLGYVLRYFPSNFRSRGRGHEVEDLGKLIGLYREWHSILLPYYSFDQFVHKVEQVAGSKRVKTCINDLREKIEGTRYFSKDSRDDNSSPVVENDLDDTMDTEMHFENEASFISNEDQHHEESILHELNESTVQNSDKPSVNDVSSRNCDNGVSKSDDLLTAEQKSRMEASRLKALERAAARLRQRELQTIDG